MDSVDLMASFEDIRFILAFLTFSLLIGVVGFRLFCGLSWYDSLCSASMALNRGNYTMTKGGKGLLFSSLYALYGSLVFFIIAGIVIDDIFRQLRGTSTTKRNPKT
jgi:hypothetical protein